MATNGLNTIFIESAMKGFATILPTLKSFSYAIEKQEATLNDTVRVPYLTNVSSSATFAYSSGYSTDSNIVSTKDVTLSSNAYQLLKITDNAASKLSGESMAKLAEGLGESLSRDVISGIFASVINETNFPTSASITSNQLTSSAGLVALVSQADDKNWSNNRSLILGSNAFSSLLLNSAVNQAYSYGGAEPIKQGIIPSVFGFSANKFTGTFPLLDAPLKGLVLDTSAIIVGLGIHSAPTAAIGNGLMSVSQVSDPSGLTVQVKMIYEPLKATTYFVMECLYGAQVGNSTGLVLLK